MARKRSVVQSLAERIRTLRDGRGWTQADLARASGLAPSQILKLERATHAARIDTIEAVAGALGTTTSELLATTGAVANPDRVDRLAERVRGLSDDAIAAVEHVVDAMIALRGRRS